MKTLDKVAFQALKVIAISHYTENSTTLKCNHCPFTPISPNRVVSKEVECLLEFLTSVGAHHGVTEQLCCCSLVGLRVQIFWYCACNIFCHSAYLHLITLYYLKARPYSNLKQLGYFIVAKSLVFWNQTSTTAGSDWTGLVLPLTLAIVSSPCSGSCCVLSPSVLCWMECWYMPGFPDNKRM